MNNIIRNKARKLNSDEIVFGNLICYGSDEMEIYDLNTDIEPNKVDPETVEIVIGQYQVKNLDEPHLAYTQDGCKIYSCTILLNGIEEIIEFKVPFDDGAAAMEDSLPAQLLNRWLKK